MLRSLRYFFSDDFAGITCSIILVLIASLIAICPGSESPFVTGLGGIYAYLCLSFLGGFCFARSTKSENPEFLLDFSGFLVAWLGFVILTIALATGFFPFLLIYSVHIFALTFLMLLSLASRAVRLEVRTNN